MCSLKKWEIKATLQVNPCQHFLLSPQGFLLTVPSLQVQNVPAQIFKGVLVSFTSDHHLADSCSARLWETTVTWELEHKWFCLKGRDLPPLVSYTPLSPSPILATMFIHCLHSSISQSWFAIFPFPPFFCFSHLKWRLFFLPLFDVSFFPSFSSCRILWCWWILQHLFSEETRIQCEKTWASMQFDSWQQPQHVLSA